MHIKLLVIAGWSFLALSGCEKYELNRQMEELCKQDGGIKVYETVNLPHEMFDSTDNVKAKSIQKDGKSFMLIAEGYEEKEEVITLKAGDPTQNGSLLLKSVVTIVRASDGDVIARSVQYGRAGGDLITFGHHSQSSCPDEPLRMRPLVFKKSA